MSTEQKTFTFPDDINKYEALVMVWKVANVALYECGQPTIEQAKQALRRDNYIEYFFGKSIKINFNRYPNIDFRLYDRENGNGAMDEVLESLAEKLSQTEASIDEV